MTSSEAIEQITTLSQRIERAKEHIEKIKRNVESGKSGVSGLYANLSTKEMDISYLSPRTSKTALLLHIAECYESISAIMSEHVTDLSKEEMGVLDKIFIKIDPATLCDD